MPPKKRSAFQDFIKNQESTFPTATDKDVQDCLLVPQPYAMFVQRRRLEMKGKIGVGTYGLATCISVLIVNKNHNHLYVSHYDQSEYDKSKVLEAKEILEKHLAIFHSWCKTGYHFATAYILGSNTKSNLGSALQGVVKQRIKFLGSDGVKAFDYDSYCYVLPNGEPKSGGLRRVAHVPRPHKQNFDECNGVADRVLCLRKQSPNRVFVYAAPEAMEA